jgi:sulfate adenylyltransferase
MSQIVQPHGGELKPLLLSNGEQDEVRSRAQKYRKIKMNSRETSDLIMLAMGAFSPLDGFMKRDDYLGVVSRMQLTNGVLWPVPITLSVTSGEAKGFKEGDTVSLVDSDSDTILGAMLVEEKYPYNPADEAREVFKTDDQNHPGVKRLFSQGDVYIGGRVEALGEGKYPALYPEFARPAETRAIFNERGWKTVAAFQTRNPIHRSHEYLTKIAMEVCDGVFVHPIVGALKEGDIPADVRMECYRALLNKYYRPENVVLKVYPMEMRYGGPREALLHAIIRQNFGCSHMIIGRDHAGVGKYYGPFDAQNIFDELPEGALEIKPLKLDWTFWCYACGEMASMKTCPHGKDDRLLISGTELRDMLANGKEPPLEFSRPEVVEVLKKFYGSV